MVVNVDKKIPDSFIDFGDIDAVASTEVFSFFYELYMLAPSVAEEVLARELPKQMQKEVLEKSLIEVS